MGFGLSLGWFWFEIETEDVGFTLTCERICGFWFEFRLVLV